MEKENDQVFVEEDLTKLDDTTDWKAKAQEIEQKRREDGIRSRERTKSLKDKIAEFETKPPAKNESKPDEFGLLQKSYLRAAGVVAEDEVELARDIQKKTGLDWVKLVDDDYFKTKLEGLRTAKSNAD